MKRALRLAAAAALACAIAAPSSPAAAGPANAPDLEERSSWHWQGQLNPGSRFRLNLVRASIRIVRRPGAARLELVARRGSLDEIDLEVIQSPGGVEITDIYRRSSPHYLTSRKECLPPDTGRGDFWASDLRLEGTLYLPADIIPSLHIMSEGSPRTS
ncbi:MAG TPA: hypothetical protein VF535_11595 [Allosphingosinicella sp.]|jgi:hypothetical protein